MCNPKVHAVIEYIKFQNDFCFDVLDVLESPQNILNHYSIFLTFTEKEMKLIQQELKKLAEEFQTNEMVRLYEEEIEPEEMRWLE